MPKPLRLVPVLLPLLLTACAGGPPKNIDNGCAIFEERYDWYESAHDRYQKWGAVQVPLAIT